VSQTPEDLSLPSHDAGVLFRAEMASQNFVLGYWKLIVGVVVAGLACILVYGQYASWDKGRQQAYAADVAKIEIRVTEILPMLEYDPSQVTPEDLGKVVTAATELATLGGVATGAASAEAHLKAAEMFRLLDNPEKQLAEYDAAIPNAAGDVVFSARSARAALLVDVGSMEASVQAWQELVATTSGYLEAYSLLQLARTQTLAGDTSGATASYDSLMTQHADSSLAERASEERAALDSAAVVVPAPVAAPTEPALAPTEPAPMEQEEAQP
jgi:hypothetical protein